MSRKKSTIASLVGRADNAWREFASNAPIIAVIRPPVSDPNERSICYGVVVDGALDEQARNSVDRVHDYVRRGFQDCALMIGCQPIGSRTYEALQEKISKGMLTVVYVLKPRYSPQDAALQHDDSRHDAA